MSRINKKTQIKKLPPILQLQLKDSLTGSYPTVARFSTDGRTGDYKTFYNDVNTLNFIDYSFDKPNLESYLYSYYPISVNTIGSTPDRVFPPDYGLVASIPAGGNQDENKLLFSVVTPGDIIIQNILPHDYLGYDNYSLRFLDPSAYLIGSDNLYDFSPHNAFSISLWVKYNVENPGSPKDILAFRTNISTTNIDYVFAADQDIATVFISPQYPTKFIQKDFTFPDSRNDLAWHHLVFTYNGQIVSGTSSDYEMFKVYYDTQITSGTFSQDSLLLDTNVMAGGPMDFTIGKMGTDTFLTQYCIWNKELSQEDIIKIYNDQANFINLEPVIDINLGLGLEKGNKFLDTEITSSLYGPGRVISGIGDSLIHFTPGQEGRIYNDHGQLASDGKSSNNAFYATGSSNINFDEPLWAKQKIEIDLTPNISQIVELIDSNNFFGSMVYWNNNLKKWERIGSGVEPSSYATDQVNFVKETCFATTPSLHFKNEEVTTQTNNDGNLITNFGFPLSDKYHATSSQQIQLSNYIQQPFLVEKIVLVFNGEIEIIDSGSFFGGFSNSSMTTFLLMNQRNVANKASVTYNTNYFNRYTDTFVPYILTGSFETNFSSILSSKDLIGKINIFGSTDSTKVAIADANYKFSDKNWNMVDVNISCSLSSEQDDSYPGIFSHVGVTGSGIINTLDLGSFLSIVDLSTTIATMNEVNRNQSFNPRRNNFRVPEKESTSGSFSIYDYIGSYGDKDIQIKSNKPNSIENSYLLMPGDNLVFGWCLPFPDRFAGKTVYYSVFNKYSNITINSGQPLRSIMKFNNDKTSKIILYGSYITEGKENNNFINQLLSSETIHEVIE